MAGKPYPVARFAHTLRCQLFKEHMGLLKPNEWERPFATMQHTNAAALDSLNVKASTEISVSGVLGHRSITPSTFERDYGKSMSREDALVMDPLSERFYHDHWVRIAKNNTQIYRDVFRCVPDDTVTTFQEYHQFVYDPTKVAQGHVNRASDPAKIDDRVKGIQGHLVQFPTEFLKKENMATADMNAPPNAAKTARKRCKSSASLSTRSVELRVSVRVKMSKVEEEDAERGWISRMAEKRNRGFDTKTTPTIHTNEHTKSKNVKDSLRTKAARIAVK
ncbi:hypothetical protein BZG36_01669, partial [Bifiguratus adelaidae]